MDITILITDTHFGVKQNSITWLNSQSEFIEDQLIPYINRETKEGNKVKLIHLGDVFDSRSTISTYIATRVVELFEKLTNAVNDFIIIGGNHDYYSPNSDSVDSLNLLLGNIGCRLVTKDVEIDGENMYVPWYQYSNHDLQSMINKNNIKNIFTHADIVTEKVVLKNCNIYSGHLHIPYIKGRIRNLGSCYALNFADSNSVRGFYVIREDKLQFVENTESIRFYRLYNDDIFNEYQFNDNDYIEIYMTQSNLSNPKYSNIIQDFVKNYKNIWVIPQANVLEGVDNVKFEGYDIASITKELIPAELQDKFNMIINNTNV